MKKLVLVLALATISFANAQKGTILVSGNLSYNSQKSADSGSFPIYTNYSFSPKVGYQYNDNWTVGVESFIGNSKSTYSSGNDKINGFSLGSFIRYSKPLGGNFSVYTDLGMGYRNEELIYFTAGSMPYTTTSKANGFYIGITPALFFNINKGFGLNFNIGGLRYNALNNKTHNGSDVKNFNFSIGQAVSVGISKNF